MSFLNKNYLIVEDLLFSNHNNRIPLNVLFLTLDTYVLTKFYYSKRIKSKYARIIFGIIVCKTF